MALRAKQYFKDYELRESVSADGRRRSELVYCGDWYQREGSRRRQRVERWLYVLFGAAGAALLLGAMMRPVEANISDKLVQGVSLLAMIPAFCVLEGAVEALFRRGALKKESYRARLLMLRVMALAGCGLNLILLLGYGAHWLRDTASADTLAAAVFSALNGLIYGAIGVNELKTRYRVVKAPPRATGETGRPDEARKYFD